MKKLQIQYKWSYLQWIMLFCMMIFLLTLPFWAFEKDDLFLLVKILWYSFFGCCALLCIFLFFINYQTAELSEKGIVIRCILYKIKEISWSDLTKVQIEKLASGTAGLSIIYKDWIVLYTDGNQTRNHGGNNKRHKGPWYIKNSNIANELLQKYCYKNGISLKDNFLI